MAIEVNLPSDILESNILSRLPVKTLVRFRAVQKSWYSLISSDPFFINKHMHQLQNNNSNLLLMKLNDRRIVVADTSSTVRYTLNFNNNRYEFTVVASFNGIVCLYGQGDYHSYGPLDQCICLFNPSLGIAKFVGYRDLISLRTRLPINATCVGFGFHKLTNDYKVVMFDNFNGHDGGVKVVEIYSLSSDSWRTVKTDLRQLKFDTYRLGGCGCEVGVYVNDNDQLDAYCWLAVRKDDDGFFYAAIRIISFDMRDEVFKEIKFPPTGGVRFGMETCLFNYKESLAVLVQCADSMFFYVWVMNAPNLWTKLGKFDRRRCQLFLGIIQETQLVMKSCFHDKVNVLDIDKCYFVHGKLSVT